MQGPSRRVLPQRAQDDAKVACREQGGRVVLDQHPPPTGQSVLMQGPSGRVLAQRVQDDAKVVRRSQGVDMVGTVSVVSELVGTLEERSGRLGLALRLQVGRR